jgi:hypothetical protein
MIRFPDGRAAGAHHRWYAPATVLAILVAACGSEGTGPEPGPEPYAIQLRTPSRPSVLPGESVQLEVIVYDAAWAEIADAEVQWTSVTPDVASVTPGGVVTGVAPGTANFEVTSGDAEGFIAYAVLAPIHEIVLAGPSDRVPPGTGFRVPRTLRGASGAVLGTVGRELTWSSSAPAVASVDGDGVVTVHAPGTATVTLRADREEVSGSVALDVGWLTLRAVQTSDVGACGVASHGRVYCWGGRPAGIDDVIHEVPWPLPGDVLFDSLTVGEEHACARALETRLAYCWGWNDAGQLGDGSFDARAEPTLVSGGVQFVALSAGVSTSCGIADGGTVWCWGSNDGGVFGTIDYAGGSLVPVAALNDVPFASISISPTTVSNPPHGCGMGTDGIAYCWGYNQLGQAGTGAQTPLEAVPVAVASEATLTSVVSGSSHSCGLDANGTTYCWGSGAVGELGVRPDLDWYPWADPTPRPVADAPAFVQIEAAFERNCGRTGAGAVYCWGAGWGAVPVQIALPGPLVNVRRTTGRYGSAFCGETGDAETWCWSGGGVQRMPGQE